MQDATAKPQGVAPKPWIDDIGAYKAGEGSVVGHDRVIKLSSNENPIGPSPRAADAFRRGVDGLAVYPDGSAAALREAMNARVMTDARFLKFREALS